MTRLVPVSQWKWALARVTYHKAKGTPAEVTAYHVSASNNHLEADIIERWPGEWATYYQYEFIEEDVAEPQSIGQLYGHSISESGWAAGERLAKKRGLL
jgi:hypothetical protein